MTPETIVGLYLFLSPLAYDFDRHSEVEYPSEDWRWRGNVIVEYSPIQPLAVSWIHISALRDGLRGEIKDIDLFSAGLRIPHLYIGAGYELSSEGAYSTVDEGKRLYWVINADYQYETSHWAIPNTVRWEMGRDFDNVNGFNVATVGWTFNF